MFCHKCGNKCLEGAGFCSKCGAKMISETVSLQDTPPSAETKLEHSIGTSDTSTKRAKSSWAGTLAGILGSIGAIALVAAFLGGGIGAVINVGIILFLAGSVLGLIDAIITKNSKKLILSITGVVVTLIALVILLGFRSDGGGSLVGTWSNDANPLHLYTFHENGNGSRGLGETFTWIVDGSTVFMTFDSHIERYSIRIRGDSLTFYNGTMPGTFQYSRVAYMAGGGQPIGNAQAGIPIQPGANNAISATFGSTFKYLGLEFAIADSWIIGEELWQDQFQIPITITNISNADVSLMSIVATAWAPDGLSIGVAFGYLNADRIRELRPGATLETFLMLPDQGDGTYEVDFSEFLGDGSVDVTITLPITRDGAMQQPTPPAANQDTGVEMYFISQAWGDSILPENTPALAVYSDGTFVFVENILWGIIRLYGEWQEPDFNAWDFQITHIREPDGSLIPLSDDWLAELGGGGFTIWDAGGQTGIDFNGDWNGGTRPGHLFEWAFPPNTPASLIANPTSAW